MTDLDPYSHNAEVHALIAWYGEKIAESLKRPNHSTDHCQKWLDRVKHLRSTLRAIPSGDY